MASKAKKTTPPSKPKAKTNSAGSHGNENLSDAVLSVALESTRKSLDDTIAQVRSLY